MVIRRLLTGIALLVLVTGHGAVRAQISANEAATVLDSLQRIYAATVAEGGAADAFQRLAGDFVDLGARIEAAGLRPGLIDIVDRSRYQIAWCHFRTGEATGDVESFNRARLVFDSLRHEAADVEVATCSAYMCAETAFWLGLLRKWQAMSKSPFSEIDLWPSLDSWEGVAAGFRLIEGDSAFSERIRFAARLRLADINYERAKVAQAVGDTPSTLAALDSAAQRCRDMRRRFSGGTARRFVDYSEAVGCLWRLFSSVDSLDCGGITSAAGVYDVAGETAFRQANLMHLRALVDTSLWPLAESLYAASVVATGRPEGLYWQGLVRSLRGEADAVGLFEQYVKASAAPNDLRSRVLRDDAQRRVDLEREDIKAANARDFLRPGSDQYLVDQAIANAKYLIRRAASRVTYWSRRPYLDKAGAFLDLSAAVVNHEGFPESGQRNHEVSFYRQIVRLMAIPRLSNHLQRAREFDDVAQKLAAVGYDFEVEARYVRAISLYEAWSRYRFAGSADEQSRAESLLNQARLILEELVRTHRSVRALYRLAEILRIADEDSLAAATCYQAVIEKTTDCTALLFLKSDCEAAIAQLPPGGGSSAAIAGLDHSLVHCPDYLVPGENVYWEGLSDDQGAMAVFAEESRILLMQYALPKKNIYPTDRMYRRSVLLDDCFVPSGAGEPFTAQVEDVLRLNPVWDLEVLVLREDGSQAVEDARIQVTVPGDTDSAPTLANNRYIRTDIPLGENVRVVFTHEDSGRYYPEVRDYLSRDLRGWRVIDTVVLAAQTGPYRVRASSVAQDIRQIHRKTDRNAVVRRAACLPSGEAIDDFKRDVRLRDLIRVERSGETAVLTVRADSGVMAYGSAAVVRSLPTEPLVSPEGVAVDDSGCIYVADFGADRVAVFEADGTQIGSIGTTGLNTEQGVMVPGHLVLPTRVVIETDRNGLSYDGAVVRRADRILVADHYGLHRFDKMGHYLDSPLGVGTAWPAIGDLYGFDVTGYGRGSRLLVANRHDATLVSFDPSVP